MLRSLSRFVPKSTRFASSGMRLCQFKDESGNIRLGAQLDNGQITDVSSIAADVKTLIAQGNEGLDRVASAVKSASDSVAMESLTIAPAIHNPEKIICVGLNYSDHCTEQNKPIPKEPVIFNKFPSAIIAAGEQIQLPKIGCNTGAGIASNSM